MMDEETKDEVLNEDWDLKRDFQRINKDVWLQKSFFENFPGGEVDLKSGQSFIKIDSRYKKFNFSPSLTKDDKKAEKGRRAKERAALLRAINRFMRDQPGCQDPREGLQITHDSKACYELWNCPTGFDVLAFLAYLLGNKDPNQQDTAYFYLIIFKNGNAYHCLVRIR